MLKEKKRKKSSSSSCSETFLTLASGWTSSQHPTAASLCGIPTLRQSTQKVNTMQ